ncbi:uncharacterized protein A1O9_00873 [Exophiala aquamarina CBS 119918]|uniref:FAD-binding PCMH-type domain-containing protein n=1 Tax=Exophiala aquamarina CBS 119918 TaxID=1182545 RepID=A0A072PS26_9EURO|nr:uncharacterized protein A1O9_00873 [Exophiala aquamarina CBS 119918]KEF62899.1 hypothetical protein A1O9_00873 [Exophiala aquamarina CBS 119918]
MPTFYADSSLQEQHDRVYYTKFSGAPVLPPNIGEEEFATIITKLKVITGDSNVITGADLSHFRDPYPLNEDEHHPSAAVCPGSVEEIRAILDVANHHKLPLWTTSRGKNFGYGGAAPRVAGTVVLALHRMNRILEVNEKFSYVVVEPGVTFFDLQKYFDDNKVGLWCSCPALGWGSLMGNTLDRGHGYTINGDRQHSIKSMEVVLPNGELLRTGQWAIIDSPNAHCCANSFGPQIDGLFLQSNLGVVTKIAIEIDTAPPAYMSFAVHVPNVEHLAPLIDTYHDLLRDKVMQNQALIVNINHFASHASQKHEYQRATGPLTPETIATLIGKFGTGYWRSIFDLYGPRSMVLARAAIIETAIGKAVPGVRIEKHLVEGENGKPVDNKIVGTLGAGFPSMRAMSLADYDLAKGDDLPGAHIDTTLILPSNGQAVSEWFTGAHALMESYGIDPFIGCHVLDKHVLFVQEYVFDRRQHDHRERGQKMICALLAKAKTKGYVSYRCHLQYMGTLLMSMSKYGRINHVR